MINLMLCPADEIDINTIYLFREARIMHLSEIGFSGSSVVNDSYNTSRKCHAVLSRLSSWLDWCYRYRVLCKFVVPTAMFVNIVILGLARWVLH